MLSNLSDVVVYLKRFYPTSPGLAEVRDDLPDGLALLYREFGALLESRSVERPAFATQDSLVPLSQLEVDDGMITFLWENQGNWSCRCRTGKGDPPVFSDAPDLDSDEEEGFVEVCDSLDHFLSTFCLQEAVLGCPHIFSAEPGATLDRVPGLEPLWLDGKYVFEGPTHNVFAIKNVDLLILAHGNEGIMLGSSSISDPEEVRQKTRLKVTPLS
ncbi:hypothetical protein ACYOEI_13125 [Singulisphaera rosea]